MTNVSKRQEWIDAIKHLRLHFSLLLMPVYLFALSQSIYQPDLRALWAFVIIHLFLYPASNLYNSYQDNDLGSVGGLKNPPPANRKMLILATLMDIVAISFTAAISLEFSALIAIYIVASRLYSSRATRLKKFPIIGFLVIFVMQGAFTYYLCSVGNGQFWRPEVLPGLDWNFSSFLKMNQYAMLACSFQIGAIYPLTQIYQHESDLADGVKTLSYKLGYKGTFYFSAIMFTIATVCYLFHFKERDMQSFYILLIAQLPIISYFGYWFSLVLKDTKHANYQNTMKMNTIAAVILNLFFLYLVVK